MVITKSWRWLIFNPAVNNEFLKLELPRAREPLGSSRLLPIDEGK